ncbi:MAG: aminotransferase class V-fold PLP-dependent enzyme [Metamycoplasmataceae bacterium]
MKNHDEFRKDFPILEKIVYLDSSALVLKPKEVVNEMNNYFLDIAISPKTSETQLAIDIKNKYHFLKKQIATLVDAKESEVIITSSTTDSLNYLALLMEDFIKENDEIILSELNHSSNIVPWLELAKKKNAKVIMTNEILPKISDKTKIISFSQKSNSFEEVNDIEKISKAIAGKDIYLFNDAAQAIVSEKVSLKNSSAIVFSSNKIFGPMGIGALVIESSLLKKLKPKKFGGGALDYIQEDLEWKPKESNLAHEPGTPNVGGIYGFSKALEYFEKSLVFTNHLKDVSSYCFDELSKLKNIEVFNTRGNSIIIFKVKDVASQEVASYLGKRNIYVRSGHFCNLSNPLNRTDNYVRISFSFYSNKDDVDKFINELKNGGDFLDFL